jgi:purine-nucleoside phosphorylase
LSIHIGAKQGDIAPGILLPGDPLRARYIAQTLLEEPVQFNEVRGMLGYTGRYDGKRASVMGTGMGIPSASIYVHELLAEYGVKTLMRVGTCGAIQGDLQLGDVVLAMTACTDSQTNQIRFGGKDYAPSASFELLQKAHDAARRLGLPVRVGTVLSSDVFYDDNPQWWKLWADYGVLAVEMETNALYTLAAKFKAQALSILTVSDNIVKRATATAQEREQEYTAMAKIALEILP